MSGKTINQFNKTKKPQVVCFIVWDKHQHKYTLTTYLHMKMRRVYSRYECVQFYTGQEVKTYLDNLGDSVFFFEVEL